MIVYTTYGKFQEEMKRYHQRTGMRLRCSLCWNIL